MNEGTVCICFATVFDLDVETSKEHREIFERYKKLVSASLCCGGILYQSVIVISTLQWHGMCYCLVSVP